MIRWWRDIWVSPTYEEYCCVVLLWVTFFNVFEEIHIVQCLWWWICYVMIDKDIMIYCDLNNIFSFLFQMMRVILSMTKLMKLQGIHHRRSERRSRRRDVRWRHRCERCVYWEYQFHHTNVFEWHESLIMMMNTNNLVFLNLFNLINVFSVLKSNSTGFKW